MNRHTKVGTERRTESIYLVNDTKRRKEKHTKIKTDRKIELILSTVLTVQLQFQEKDRKAEKLSKRQTGRHRESKLAKSGSATKRYNMIGVLLVSLI
jgi:hypothetical protein